LPFTDDDQNWDWGVLNAADDAALGAWAYRKMIKAGIDPKEQLKRFGEFIGRTDLVPAPDGAPADPGGAPVADVNDMSLDAKAARVKAAREKGRQFRGVKEMKIKTSELYRIIQEELEVILTNEEVEEVFDLDMSALLDEMMSEEDLNEEDDWIQGADLKKGRCTPMGTPECPEGSPQYNLAKRFKSGDIHKANLKKGKNPHGPG